MIMLSRKSLDRAATVHPDLRRVVARAANEAEKSEDFMVLEGLRTREQMIINYGKGRTAAQLIGKGIDPALARKHALPSAAKVTWLNNPFMSNHRAYADGFSRAVDLAPYPIDWNDLGRFRKLMALMKRAAALENVRISCGGEWAKPDLPHFELA